MAVSTTTSDVRLLRARCHGGVVAPGESGWDAARQAFDLAVDQRPAAVALPADEEDVVAVVRFARERGLRVAPQASGRGAATLGCLEDTLLVRTSALDGVEIDVAAGIARVQAGVRWGRVAERLSPLGLAPLAGLSPSTSVVGDTLTGGLGWLARKHGLQANGVAAIELVTADGRLVRTDHHHDAELFWALRGGGGSFGVVTAIELRLLPLVVLHAGALFFPIERARQVLHAWREWTTGLPDELTSVGRIVQFPPTADVPDQLRGRACAIVAAAYLGDAAGASELLQQLRELGPQLDTFATIAPGTLSRLHMEGQRPRPLIGDHLLTGDLPALAIDALADVAGPGSGSPLRSVELRHLGGELARSRPSAGALAALTGSFALHAVGVPRDARHADAIREHVPRVTAALAHYGTGAHLGLAEQPTDLRRAFGPDVLTRLCAARARYDPDGLVVANHPISAARAEARSSKSVRSRWFSVSDAARSSSTRASATRPSFASRSPRTLGSR